MFKLLILIFQDNLAKHFTTVVNRVKSPIKQSLTVCRWKFPIWWEKNGSWKLRRAQDVQLPGTLLWPWLHLDGRSGPDSARTNRLSRAKP